MTNYFKMMLNVYCLIGQESENAKLLQILWTLYMKYTLEKNNKLCRTLDLLSMIFYH